LDSGALFKELKKLVAKNNATALVRPSIAPVAIQARPFDGPNFVLDAPQGFSHPPLMAGTIEI
jgi:hypothetical protein